MIEADTNYERTKAERTARAIAVATDAHHGQTRLDGSPALLHALRVGNKFEAHSFGAVCGYLHDVVEDSAYTVEDIRAVFGSGVADVIDLVSRRKEAEGETYWQYIDRICHAPGNDVGHIAKTVKIFDLRDNINSPGAPESLTERHRTALAKIERSVRR